MLVRVYKTSASTKDRLDIHLTRAGDRASHGLLVLRIGFFQDHVANKAPPVHRDPEPSGGLPAGQWAHLLVVAWKGHQPTIHPRGGELLHGSCHLLLPVSISSLSMYSLAHAKH